MLGGGLILRARTRSVALALVVNFAFSFAPLVADAPIASNARAQAVSDGWRLVGNDQGVLISTRQLPGQSQPVFRGQATIAGSVLHVLAVVLDSPKSVHWVKGASEMTIVRELDGRTQFVQMLTDLPWPIRDRDTIMKRTVDVLTPASEFRVRFLCAPGELPEQRGAIRVQHCDSHFALRAVEPNKTYVDYQVQIDAGGGLPDWSVHWMEKRITVDTLSRLAEQIVRTTGQYASVMQRWASER
jgi:hypothetical protein